MRYGKRFVGVVAILGLFGLVLGPTTPPQRLVFQLAQSAAASGGRTLHFTGVLTDPATGNPLSGNFDMGFSIFDVATGGTALWTETQPAVQARRGVFNVQLGSAVAFPDGLFDGSARYLEVRIDADPPLSPRVQISRVGNSFFADRAGDVRCAGGQCVDKDDVKDRAIGREKLEDKAVGRGQLDDKAVGREKLEDRSVGRAQLDDKAVGQGQLEDRAVGRAQLGDKAVGRDHVEDRAIGTAQLADGAVTAGKLAAEVLELVRAQPGARAPYGVAQLGPFDGSADVAIGVDGLPILADPGPDGVRAIHCEDPECAEVTETAIPVGGGGNAAVVVGADGRPLVFAGSAVVRCEDVACRRPGVPTPFPGPETPAAMLAADGFPLVLAGDTVVHCQNEACTSYDRGQSGVTAMAMGSDGLPVVVHAGGSVELARCLDPGCSGEGPPQVVATDAVGPAAVSVGADGLPVVAYIAPGPQPTPEAPSPAPYQLSVVHCADLDCSTTDVPGAVLLSMIPRSVAAETGADGLPLFALVGRTERFRGLLTVRCVAGACSATPVLPTAGPAGSRGPFPASDPALTVGADGYPVMALGLDTGGGTLLGVVHCSNRFCVPYFRQH